MRMKGDKLLAPNVALMNVERKTFNRVYISSPSSSSARSFCQ